MEKLIALSRLFSVSVGWLLGEEDETGAEGPAPELNETQLAMVEEIAARYLAALPQPEAAPPGGEGKQPKPEPESQPERPRRRRWPRVLAGCGMAVLAILLFNLFDRLDRVTQDYRNLQYSLQNIQDVVNSQIGSITNRVEEILQSQNELTAEYHTQHLSSDLAANTAAFQVYAVPKTYVPGMTALFQARSGDELTQLEVTQPDGNNAFSGTLTCPLTDDITLSVIFRTGDREETQLLDHYDYLYASTFPALFFDSGSLFFEEEDGVLPAQLPADGKTIMGYDPNEGTELSTDGMDLRVGLFRDHKLVLWYQQGSREVTLNGASAQEQVWYRPQAVTLEPGHEYVEVILYTDAYGRQRAYPDAPLVYHEQDGTWGGPGTYTTENDPAAWDF